MKKLMNKKGFTLIEMLVVIAIIAILVAIIIPTVTSATKKAEYATDAANLRSAKAEISIKYLDGTLSESSTSAQITAALTGGTAPVSKSNSGAFSASIATGGVITVKYGDYTINDFAIGAETGTLGTTHS